MSVSSYGVVLACVLFLMCLHSHIPQVEGTCEESHRDDCVISGNVEIRFRNKLELEKPKCKTSMKRQILKFRWKPPGADVGSANVSCFLFPLAAAQALANGSDGMPPKEIGVFAESLNYTAVLTNVKKNSWKCEVDGLLAGIWIPLLGQFLSSDHPDRDKQRWIFSELDLTKRITRPKINTMYPRLLMADTKTSVDIHGESIESPAKCQVILGNKRPPKSVSAAVTNSSLATCTIQGEEGRATLLFSWSNGCSTEFAIEFVDRPTFTRIIPQVLPPRGRNSFELHMKPGESTETKNEIAMFLPTRVQPTARLGCLPDSTFDGEFYFLSDVDWVANFTISRASFNASDPMCNVSVSLNGRDYLVTDQVLQIKDPVVRFVSSKEGVVLGDRTAIAVELDSPVSLPSSVSLKLMSDRKSALNRFTLRESIVTWKPGEVGTKYFILENTSKPRRDHIRDTFVGELVNGVNCDVDRNRSLIKLITIKRDRLPVFHVSAPQTLYPLSSEALVVNITLVHGSSKLGSMLEYETSATQMNPRCNRERIVDYVSALSGTLRWKRLERRRMLEIPVHWDNVDYCDEVMVTVTLRGVRTATIRNPEAIVTWVYGTPKGFCPPGLVRTRRSRRTLPFELLDSEDISLTDLRIEGHQTQSNAIHDTALVPPFLSTRMNYTAMIPYNMEDIRLLIFNKGEPEDVTISDQNCEFDDKLYWTKNVGDPERLLQAEIRMSTHLDQCMLQVFAPLPFSCRQNGSCSQVESVGNHNREGLVERESGDYEFEDEIISPSTGISPLDEEVARPSTAFRVDFLKLSNPQVALLRAVEIRNTTHVITLCGPKDEFSVQGLSTDGDFQSIKGYPKHPCHTQRINYVHETLDGMELIVIPRLYYPEMTSTRVEVSGRLLHDIRDIENQQPTQLSADNGALMATVFEGVPLTNASFSFDVRVTAEDNVTSNLYRFVYGEADSLYQLYAPGSSFDAEQTSQDLDRVSNETSTTARPGLTAEKRFCEECPAGTFSIGVDALQCALCQPGHFSNQLGSPSCEPCLEGTFTYTWGSEMCRPCMIGSAANQRGSQYCQLCPDGYMTDREGAAHCTVPVESTDLRRYYAVIASFDVVLNGTSLEEIERLGACTATFAAWSWLRNAFVAVHASGILVLKMLIRTDVASALNISVGDVAVTKIAPFGRHALSIDVDTTFKVEVSKDAEPDEVDKRIRATKLHGDDAVNSFGDDPDRILRRTTAATHTHAKLNKDSTKFRASNPDEWRDDRWSEEARVIYPIISACLLFLSSTLLICVRTKKRRQRGGQANIGQWSTLQERSGSSSNESELQLATFGFMRHRPLSSRTTIDP